MKRMYFILFLGVALMACSAPADLDIPGSVPDAEMEREWLGRVIRYVGRMPDKADARSRLESQYDEHYLGQISSHRLDRIYQSGDEVFLLISRAAPSLEVKRVSTGIHTRWQGDSLVHYHEVFRTWKLTEGVLLPRADSLFALMVSGADLSPYRSDQKGDAYIEFPDAETAFDTLRRIWVSKREDPVGEMKALYQAAPTNK